MAKKVKEVKKAAVDTVVETVAPVSEDSPAKAEFRALIATYERQNPLKFADKKEALFAKLETL